MPMSLNVPDDAFDLLGSTMLSGRWSLISAYVRKPRSLPSLIRFFRRVRRVSASSFGISAGMSQASLPPPAAALALGLDLGDLGFEELERLLGARLDRRLGRLAAAFGSILAVGYRRSLCSRGSFRLFRRLFRWCLAFSDFLGAGRAFATGRFSARTT